MCLLSQADLNGRGAHQIHLKQKVIYYEALLSVADGASVVPDQRAEFYRNLLGRPGREPVPLPLEDHPAAAHPPLPDANPLAALEEDPGSSDDEIADIVLEAHPPEHEVPFEAPAPIPDPSSDASSADQLAGQLQTNQ